MVVEDEFVTEFVLLQVEDRLAKDTLARHPVLDPPIDIVTIADSRAGCRTSVPLATPFSSCGGAFGHDYHLQRL